ncbi:hypothetical protein FRACYDRAFT_225496 [Fragilariopsis cylindrus CCMP1102]|uniref:BTB domain-containing protein n=1 Tax=Fragilariopsis cylindrus CCMP1102 TaxID=635003 RepID=A0A1E7FJ09_9STRA|nr:hypothetical protein FRACYDRAFT_225496 [Fragilariopsis cylindrus CCMP1102]|eukprot:OEU18156.1 hypothetical protein FRACYDRAFT_225496 [Fragilariopsis cylindrus CCMP1102]
MQQEKDILQNEIETMNNSITSNDDPIIEIDAGGKIIRARRSTLTLAPDTTFSSIFSENWTQNDRVFLDHDPELIEIIVNSLRAKNIEDPSNPMKSLTIPDGKKEEFELLLRYFGLSDFFYPSPVFLPFDIGKIEVVQPHGSPVVVTKSESKIRFSHNVSINSDYFATCKPSLNSSGEGIFWKITIDTLNPAHHWLFLGIIGNLNPSIFSSWKDSTAYGLGGECAVKNGIYEDSEIERLSQGDCIYFHLKSNKLTMLNAEKNLKTVIDIDTTVSDTYYINFNFYSPDTKISLEPLTEDECERMLEN